MIPLFDRFDLRCKSPFGALPSGQCAAFSLYPPRQSGFSHVVLVAFWESTDQTTELPLHWKNRIGTQDQFSGALETAGYTGLIWYFFRLERIDGTVSCYGADGYSTAPSPFQLTVYDPTFAPPAWFGAGVTYQIFPDRFRRTGQPVLSPGQTIHENWADTPDFLPDSTGNIQNRDFFGGTLLGIQEKLPYLKQLGVDTLYLCPIFEAAENHRYGVADYETIDPMLGSNADFSALCDAVHALGMRLILDGVFSHTGSISRYFNGDGSYQTVGACQSQNSPYYPWYHFSHYPDQYDCWWGIKTLPEVNELEPSYLSYIVTGENSIVRRWLRAGADGWRLDVADELPDAFLSALYQVVKETKPEAVVIGEVWEDGSHKISYGQRRRYLLGGHLDGLMNYPFRTALLQYLLQEDGAGFQTTMETLREHYPPGAFYTAMNSLGTHDTPRILTLLGGGEAAASLSRLEKSHYRLAPEARALAMQRLRLAGLLLFSFPGSPTLYYGDEAGLEGLEDPFNRKTYPWGMTDSCLILFFTQLAALRHQHPALQGGALHYYIAQGPLLCFLRTTETETILTAINCGQQAQTIPLPWHGSTKDLCKQALLPATDSLVLRPRSGGLYQEVL